MDKRFYTRLTAGRSRFLAIAVFMVIACNCPAETIAERLRQLFVSPAASNAGEELLEPDQAFRFSASVAGTDLIILMWQIADGYYLYRDKFSVSVADADTDIILGKLILPPGRIKEDESFGKVAINTGDIRVNVPVKRKGSQQASFTLRVVYQGCKEDTICYPPVRKEIPLVFAATTHGGKGQDESR